MFAVAIYKDYLISAGYDRIIRIFDIKTTELLRKLCGHIDLIRTIDVYGADPKQPLIVSGSWDRSIRVWDMETGCCLQIMTGHTNRLKCVLVCELTTPGIVLSGSDDTTMRAWDISTGHQIAEYNGHSHCVLSIAASTQAEPIAASGSTDCVICVWELISGQNMFNLRGHEAGVCALVFAKPSVDGSAPALISSSGDSTIRIWSMQTGSQLQILKGHDFGIIALSMWQEQSVPYPYLLSCAQNGTIQIWDLHSLELKKTAKTKTNYLLSIAQKAGLDNIMAFCGAEGYIRVQRTEEIYNAADVIGSPASPSRRAERAPNRASPKRKNRSVKSNVSRSNSIESTASDSFLSYSFNDDDTSAQNSIGRSVSTVFSPTGQIKMHIPDDVVLDTIISRQRSQVMADTKAISDSLPITPEDDNNLQRYSSRIAAGIPSSPATNEGRIGEQNENDEEEEEMSVCSFDARVIRSVIQEVEEKEVEPPSRTCSVEDYSTAFVDLQIGTDNNFMDSDDVNSVMTEDDVNIFVNAKSSRNGTRRFVRGGSRNGRLNHRSNGNDGSSLHGGSSISSVDKSIQSSASVESIPRISSAKWKHRGRHGPIKSITKGLGIGSRQSELKKAATVSRSRGLPRIIETSKPFILVVSVESSAYTALPPPAKPNNQSRMSKQPVTIKHKNPSTIVSSPKYLPQIGQTSHNGSQHYNMDDTFKSIPSDCSESISSDFLAVSAKPQSPPDRKKVVDHKYQQK